MKKMLFLIGMALVLGGCRTYLIDSNPRGLAVTINDIEYGITPIEYKTGEHFTVEVAPPTRMQLKKHEEENNKVISTWSTIRQWKSIWPDKSPSGTIFFQFINSEYDKPTTEEELKELYYYLEEDAENLKRKQDMLKKD